MADLFLVLFFVSLIGLITGLANPSIFTRITKKEITRKKIGLGFGVAMLVFFVLVGITNEPKEKVAQPTQLQSEKEVAIGEMTEKATEDETEREPERNTEETGETREAIETDPLEVIEPEPEPENKSAISDEKAIELIRISLEYVGIPITSIEVVDGRKNGGTKSLLLAYTLTATTQAQSGEEIGLVSGTFIGVKKMGWDIDELGVVIGNTQGNAVGMWYCSKEWTDSFLKGEITQEELVLKILSSISNL